MMSLQTSTWEDVEALRTSIQKRTLDSVQEGAQTFAESFASCCTSVVLARLFVVLPMSQLSPGDRRFASDLVRQDTRLGEGTPVLTLLGTAGRQTNWCHREQSTGHRAIPLLGAAFVQNIPMIARLLGDLEVSFAGLDEGKVLDTRPLLGGKNAAFYVADARGTRDDEGRRIIPNGEFVDAYGIRTVFGMGGAYVDGTLAVAIAFTSESIDRMVVDRFPSLISNFKMATSAALARGRIYAAESD